MERLLSYITVLPSNENEVEVFFEEIKKEILLAPDDADKIWEQIYSCSMLFDKLLSDERLVDFYKEYCQR
jgi:hypothetical protein